ncbi:MAG: type IV secretion system protein [Rickettsiales bacterium]
MLFPQEAFSYDFDEPYGVYDLTDPGNTIGPPPPPGSDPTTFIRVCPIEGELSRDQNMLKYGFTKRIVLCVKESIVSAVYYVLVPFSEYFAKLIAIMATLAVAIWGIQMAGGHREASTREAFLLAVKIGMVVMFTDNFAAVYFDPDNEHGGLFGMILDAMEDFLGIIVGYAVIDSSLVENCPIFDPDLLPEQVFSHAIFGVWDVVDCTLDSLVGGIFSPISLMAGVVGFLIATFLSSVVGFFIGLLGFMLISMLLMAIARAVYIFISAYIAFALMILISPIFIPMVLFRATKAYFEKWLRLTIGFVLQPIFIFVYLTMMLAAYDSIVFDGDRSLYRAVVGGHIDHGPDDPIPGVYVSFGQWMHAKEIYYEIKHGEAAVQINHNPVEEACAEEECQTDSAINKHDSGVLGTIGEEITPMVSQWQSDIYDILGDQHIFKTSIPITGANIAKLAYLSRSYTGNPNMPDLDVKNAYDRYEQCRNNPGKGQPGHIPSCLINPDPENFLPNHYEPYIINLFISILMAVVTGYIFMLMLEYLPFIGSGISGESLSIPTFGVGSMAPPGSKFVKNMQTKLANNFTGRS